MKASQRPAWSLAPTGHPREAGTEARLSLLSEREAQSGQSVRGMLSRAPRTRPSASSLCQDQREPGGGPRWAQASLASQGPEEGWVPAELLSSGRAWAWACGAAAARVSLAGLCLICAVGVEPVTPRVK